MLRAQFPVSNIETLPPFAPKKNNRIVVPAATCTVYACNSRRYGIHCMIYVHCLISDVSMEVLVLQ